MDTMKLEESMAGFAGRFGKISVPIIIATLLITVVLLGNIATSPPRFNTDLDAFRPDSNAKTAHERIHENFPNETRPMFIHVTSDDGQNILSLQNIKAMNVHLRAIENLSTESDEAVVVWTTTPSILQTALDEEANGVLLDDVSSWNELIDLIAADDVECRLTSDDQFLSAATYASSALLFIE